MFFFMIRIICALFFQTRRLSVFVSLFNMQQFHFQQINRFIFDNVSVSPSKWFTLKSSKTFSELHHSDIFDSQIIDVASPNDSLCYELLDRIPFFCK